MMEKIKKAQQIVVPGDLLATEIDFDAGPGTYAISGSIRASLGGFVTINPPSNGSLKRGMLVVAREGSSILVPDVDALVTCRITRITHLQASAEILLLNGLPVSEPFHAVIRRENVRESEIDKVRRYRREFFAAINLTVYKLLPVPQVVIEECFKPGDLVLAQVVSLGDSRSYFVGTARSDLGVLHGVADTGETMAPMSAEWMQVPATGLREKRKVAKPAV